MKAPVKPAVTKSVNQGEKEPIKNGEETEIGDHAELVSKVYPWFCIEGNCARH